MAMAAAVEDFDRSKASQGSAIKMIEPATMLAKLPI
jgi:hypothetical protein